MRKGISILFTVSVSICMILAISACHPGPSDGDARAASSPSARVAQAQRGNISHVLTLAGQFQPYQVVDVHPKVSGYMKKINVDIGDIVQQGQTLAVLEVPELKAQLQQTVFAAGPEQGRDHARRSTKSTAPLLRTRLSTLPTSACRRQPRGIPA